MELWVSPSPTTAARLAPDLASALTMTLGHRTHARNWMPTARGPVLCVPVPYRACGSPVTPHPLCRSLPCCSHGQLTPTAPSDASRVLKAAPGMAPHASGAQPPSPNVGSHGFGALTAVFSKFSQNKPPLPLQVKTFGDFMFHDPSKAN